MKKKYLAILGAVAVLAMAMATACYSKSNTETAAARTETTASQQEETKEEPQKETKETAKEESAADKEENKSTDAEESTMTGEISDIKDFMFTISSDGHDYAFSFDNDKNPEGLADVKDGDTVTVTYTGTVDEVDAFDGTVLSVKKAK